MRPKATVSLPAVPGFVRLERRGPSASGQVGCLLFLAILLTLIGGGILVGYWVNPKGEGDMWVVPVVGGAFFLVGVLLLWAGVRGVRGLKVPAPELWRDAAAPLVPGGRVRLRLRQPGPVTFEKLKVKALCERVYRRVVSKKDGTTVEDQETLWEQALLELHGERVAAGAVLDRELVLDLPAEARPTGPAEPDGRVRWAIEIWGEAGLLRATYHPFEIEVRGAAG